MRRTENGQGEKRRKRRKRVLVRDRRASHNPRDWTKYSENCGLDMKGKWRRREVSENSNLNLQLARITFFFFLHQGF